MSTVEKHMNIIPLNGVCMRTSNGDEDTVLCEPRLRVRYCVAFDMDHVPVRKCLDERCRVFLRQHDGMTHMA